MKPPFHVRETTFPELGFCKMEASGSPIWRIVDRASGCVIGPIYKSRPELLQDLVRFAQEFGCRNSFPPVEGTSNASRESRDVGKANWLNGLRVVRVGSTIHIPLPKDAWAAIEGGCACRFCSKDGSVNELAYWDTLAIDMAKPPGADYAWTVHAPEYHGAVARRKAGA